MQMKFQSMNHECKELEINREIKYQIPYVHDDFVFRTPFGGFWWQNIGYDVSFDYTIAFVANEFGHSHGTRILNFYKFLFFSANSF